MNNTEARRKVQQKLPDFPVRAAHDGEPTALERAEGERRLKLVIEILAEADMKRLQEAVVENSLSGEPKPKEMKKRG